MTAGDKGLVRYIGLGSTTALVVANVIGAGVSTRVERDSPSICAAGDLTLRARAGDRTHVGNPRRWHRRRASRAARHRDAQPFRLLAFAAFVPATWRPVAKGLRWPRSSTRRPSPARARTVWPLPGRHRQPHLAARGGRARRGDRRRRGAGQRDPQRCRSGLERGRGAQDVNRQGAARGRVNDALLARLTDDDYLRPPPPTLHSSTPWAVPCPASRSSLSTEPAWRSVPQRRWRSR
jgi:hypothetical protein